MKNANTQSREQQPEFVDLTAFYGKEISEDDVWNNINAIAGKELLPTAEEGIYFAIADTLKQKDHVIRGGGQNSKRQQINRGMYLSNIQEIAKKAKYVGTENNSDFRNKNKKGTVAFHYFESTVKIDENFYKVKFAAAEYTQQEIERLKKIGKLPLSTVSSETSNLQNIWLSSPNKHSISHGKKMSSKVPSVLYLYNIKEQSLGRNYLNQIQNSQNQSPIQMDIRSIQNQKETHNMENENTQTREQQLDFIDLTEEYNNLFPQTGESKKADSYTENMWENINSIAGKKMLQTSSDELYIGIIGTKDKKSHVLFGDKPRNKSELKRETVYVLNLEKLINAAKYSDTDKTKNPTKKEKKEILAYHYFKTRVKINDSFYNIRFATEELTINEIERYKKIGKLPPAEVSSGKSNLRTTWKSSPKNSIIANEQNLSSRVPKYSFLYQISDSRDREYEIQYSQKQTLNQKETHNMENENTQTQEQQQIEQNVTNTLIDKIRKTGLDVIIDKEKMREILESGQYVQKMAAYHGTSHENEGETFFNGYGTYVVSVNENYAKQHGLKIASKKYGDTFYVKEQTLNDFLSEHNFSPYWNELVKQSNFRSPDELNNAMMIADTKGNAELERQKGELSTLFKYSLIEYKKEQTYLYSVDIPDNTGKNYLLYNNPIGLENANRINAELEKMNVEWKVSRNDTGRQVYFDVLSKNLFNGNQKTASEFLKNCGYVGMEMDSTNYIVFDENDMNVKNRLQYMIDGNNNVLGLAAGNAVILDPDFLNSNTPAHEYNHFWDRCIRQSNPELIAKGIDIFKETNYWSDVEKLQSYKEGWSKLDKTQDEHGISNYDYEVFSEMHSRIVGQFASEVLTRITVENGGDIADAVIDWDKEAKEYIAREFGNDFPEPEHGSETYEYDSAKQKYIQDFFAQPMKDLWNGRQIVQELGNENNLIQKMIATEQNENAVIGQEQTVADNDNLLVVPDNEALKNAGWRWACDNNTYDNWVLVNENIDGFEKYAASYHKHDDSWFMNNENDKKITVFPDGWQPSSFYQFKKLVEDKVALYYGLTQTQSNETVIENLNPKLENNNSQDNDFINAINESEQAINEATNGMGHDPTDGLPLDFDPPLTEEQMDMWSEIAETEGNTHSDEVFDMYETADGKLFYPEEIVPPSVEESLKNVYPENEVDTTEKKVNAYASEIYSMLSNFSTANPADWNVDKATAVTLHHLAAVADIKNSEREESIEKIKEYFTTDEYAKEEESIGKTFSEIIKTKDENGYDFDFAKKWEETYFNTQNTSSLSEDINLLSRNEIGLKDEFITISNHTPYIFKNLKQHGFEDGKIAIYKDKLARGLFLPVTERHGHDNSLTKENVAETFENLANPRAILLSKDGKSLIGVYDVPDKKNEPMMVSFRHENGQIEVNLMTSIYGKPGKDIEHWIDNGQLLYVNDMEKEKAFTLPSRQLRISDINTSSLNIQTKSEIVNELTLDGKIEIPTFAMATENGLRTCEHFKVESINKEQKKMTVSNDKGEKTVLDENAIKAIVSPEIDALNKKKNDIVWTGEKVPEFAMITQHGLQTFKDMTVEKYNAESKSWTLSNADGQSVNVTDRTLKELTSDQRIKQVQKFTNDTLARDKMLVTQYNDYFKQRDNTAYNFRHNLSVYCRKEANSPVDALKIASIIIKEMPVEERRKTKELLNTMRRDGETVNQVIANMYTEAVKDVPLNEAYIANNHHDKKIARPMYDTLSVKGEKIDRDFNLKIGDNISNMAFKMGKTFGIGKETLYQNCTIVSASKEGNVVTLMDGNKSYYDVPRDTFLKEYAKQQKHGQKLENHQQRQHRYNMQMSVEY